VWEALCGRYSENPSVLRRGRRAVARTSKHIFVFAIDPLSLHFLYLYLALIHIAHIIYMLGIICVPH